MSCPLPLLQIKLTDISIYRFACSPSLCIHIPGIIHLLWILQGGDQLSNRHISLIMPHPQTMHHKTHSRGWTTTDLFNGLIDDPLIRISGSCRFPGPLLDCHIRCVTESAYFSRPSVCNGTAGTVWWQGAGFTRRHSSSSFVWKGEVQLIIKAFYK